MNKLALIGENISHSLSQSIYESLLNKSIDYTLIDCSHPDEIPSLQELFASYEGVSITAPYKKHFIDKVIITQEVRGLGAINCLSIRNGKYYGTNTDYLAIKDFFKQLKNTYGSKIEVIVLGDGSMSRVTESLLITMDIKYNIYSRSNGDDIQNLNIVDSFKNRSDYNIVINSCGRAFVFEGMIDRKTTFWDYNYSFEAHSDLSKRCNYIDGIGLLESQARFALEFWKK